MTLGLLLSVLVAAGVWAYDHRSDSEERTIRGVSIERSGADGLWRMLAAQTPVSERAKLLDYETVVSESGEVAELNFIVVDREAGGYVHTEAAYDAEKELLHLRRTGPMEEWLQYDRQIDAERFFARVEDDELMRLRPGRHHPYVKLKLMEDGTQANYGIRGRPTFEVAEGGTRGIADERLPVQGYWLSVCGMASADPLFGGCEDVADYLFEIGGPSALRETE